MGKVNKASKNKVKLSFDSSTSTPIDIIKEAESIRDGYQRLDLIPMQHVLQFMADSAVAYATDILDVKAMGKLLINLDYVHSRRASIVGHFNSKGYIDADGNTIRQIGVNPYDIQHRTLADIFATILHEVLHFLANIDDNKPTLGIPKGQGDTSRQGRYHNKNFQNIVTRIPLLQFIPDDRLGCITSVSEQGIQFTTEHFPNMDVFNIGKVMEEPKAKKEMDTRLVCQECDYSVALRPSLAKRVHGIPAFDREYADNSVLGYQEVGNHHGVPMIQA